MSYSKSIRPVVLTFLHYYLPGSKSGGPVRTIANMVEALGDRIDFRIVTADRDVGEIERYQHLAASDGWQDVGNAKVLYLAPSNRRMRDISKIIRETTHDTLYLNSFFDPVFTAKPLLARRLGLAPVTRCVVAPRGEFSPGALKLKAARKRVFRVVSRPIGIYHGLIWQASSDREAQDIAREMAGAATDIRVATDLPAQALAPVPSVHSPRAEGQPLRVVFLSRISPMKNLVFALEVAKQVQTPMSFDIYGQLEDQAYWARCETLIAQMPSHVAVRYRGSLDHHDVSATLARYDLFFLPTHGENYGHAIVESLAVGTPVLISDATPWRNLTAQGIGWDLSLRDTAPFVASLETMSARGQAEEARHRHLAAAFFQKQLHDKGALADNLSLFAPGGDTTPTKERYPLNE